ncbi:Inner membrane protein YgbE [Phytobacter ursingii]|nr:membrane protein [Enterobacter hormaechei]VTP17607.1 Inner membrane protein YgbE [Phytobacter ursingii]
MWGVSCFVGCQLTGSDMRNSQNITISRSDTITTSDETTWSLPGAAVGFVAWLLALAIPFLIYGPNTLFFFLYTWPFFLALMPVSVVVGIALHSIVNGKLLYSIVLTALTVVAMFGALFMWLMG